ncbi:MAG: murein biosynthesis integral membrane protein MurJ [Candidatus Buchananbacteria bacterium]|jgi:putative peptidoglycan lipid II flippase
MFEKIKKLLSKANSQSQSITSAAVVIGGLSLVSRFLGIFRDRVLAGQFGAGDVLDAYYAAFRLPDLVYNLLILGAVSAGLIPVFTSLLARHHQKDAWKLINSILNLLSILLLAVCTILFFSAPWLVPLITPGFAPEKMELVISLSRIMFLSPFFLGLSAIFSSVLQSHRKFLIYSLAPIFYNLGIIFGAVYLVESLGVNGLAWGVVIGALAHMTVQLLPIFSVGFKYKFDLNFRDKNVLKVVTMMVPRTISLAISQINFIIITIIASTLAAGSLAIFNLSNNLQSFPLGIFGVSLGVAALPVLSALAAEKKTKDFVRAISSTFRQILFFIVPISVILYVLRAQIVRVLLGSGNFNWYDTRLTAACLAIFCLGLFAQGAYPLVIRGFYALHNTKTPFYIGLLTMVVDIIALFYFRWLFSFDNWFSFGAAAMLRLSDLWGIVDFRVLALPAAITVSSIFELIVLMIALRKKIGLLDGRKMIDSSSRIIFASLGGGIIAYFLLQIMDQYVPTEYVWGILTQGSIAGLAGIAGYAGLGYLLNLEEMFIFFGSIKRKLFRSVVVMAEDSINEADKG